MKSKQRDGDLLSGWVNTQQHGIRKSRRTPTSPVGGGGLRFAFYGRVSTEDFQDHESSRAWQRNAANELIAGQGAIVAEFFDRGHSRRLAWHHRPQAAALLAALADPDRGFDAVVIGEYERAFFGNQLTELLPLVAKHAVQLWLPETNGRFDGTDPAHQALVMLLGAQSKREVLRSRFRVLAAMQAQTVQQGRYLGGRPPYGYRLVHAGPHPNAAHARWGRRLQRLEPDPGHRPPRSVDLRPTSGRSQRLPHRPRPQRPRSSLPIKRGPRPQPPPLRCRVDIADRSHDPGQPTLYRSAGLEPATHRPQPHHARHAGAPAVEPTRRLGDLQEHRPPATDQRGRLHRRPNHHRHTHTRRRSTAAPATAADTATPAPNPPHQTDPRPSTCAKTASWPASPPASNRRHRPTQRHWPAPSVREASRSCAAPTPARWIPAHQPANQNPADQLNKPRRAQRAQLVLRIQDRDDQSIQIAIAVGDVGQLVFDDAEPNR